MNSTLKVLERPNRESCYNGAYDHCDYRPDVDCLQSRYEAITPGRIVIDRSFRPTGAMRWEADSIDFGESNADNFLPSMKLEAVIRVVGDHQGEFHRTEPGINFSRSDH